MELHSPINSVAAKRLWNFLRIAFFMIRKGLMSKRKLIMDMNLKMKRGKVLGKSLGNLIFHHHSRSADSRGFGLQEYEFSCSNSPNPVFFHAGEKITSMVSPSSIRLSNYSSEEEENDSGSECQVDNEAEEFIRRFYEQLRIQSRTALLEYQESQYQEMLARGTG
ncbi:DUF761 domain-containing protein [Cinnamomum micranthum f. kanehirae]|uniref:DUF761 domain-containing protein n=1 Tax=Cinnamomum micranthum f. kanehirae TaxID=337451 RepID=A0A3S3LZL4_9MAGN|nr:DUF761 domain-containing protein [Cinnamomum micranthum f. kanehirae]